MKHVGHVWEVVSASFRGGIEERANGEGSRGGVDGFASFLRRIRSIVGVGWEGMSWRGMGRPTKHGGLGEGDREEVLTCLTIGESGCSPRRRD